MNIAAANDEGFAIITDDEVDFCSASHCSRLRKASFYLAYFRVS
jgi:hypothetical protein